MSGGLLFNYHATVKDDQLTAKIHEFVAATGRAVKEVTREAIKGMVKDALTYTPPGSSDARSAKKAQQAGEGAVMRDLNLMGFAPVPIKGYKEYKDTFWGHKLKAPLRIKTKLNPKFDDPLAIHKARIAAARGRGGRVTRGGKQAWYVPLNKYRALQLNLLFHVGRLASGWVPAALELGINVPKFIKRHGGADRGTTVKIQANGDRVTMTVVNHFPDTASDIAADVERRIERFKQYRINAFSRQLKAKLSGVWKKG